MCSLVMSLFSQDYIKTEVEKSYIHNYYFAFA